jgi:6-pyruvoyltetrahydropterin/6-carboxytetrahydropterin synthase
MITAYRKAHFNAAHRLYRPDWSDERNEEVFGKCSNVHYHGHNYNLEVGVSGEIDPETGYLIDLKVLKDLIKSEVEDYMDHKNLNLEVEEFKNLNPTAENIAVVIWNRLRAKLEDKFSLEVTLYETDRNYVRYTGSKIIDK